METTSITWNQTTSQDLPHNTTTFSNVTSTMSYDNITDHATPKTFMDYTEYDVAKFINDYYLYLVCALGIPGNLACIVTLTFMRPILSSAIYMVALAVADIVALALKMLYLQLTAMDVQLGNHGCQLIFMLGTVFHEYANWILVALTMERFIAIWFPFKVKKLCTRRNSVYVLVAMLLVFVLANIQFFFTFEEVQDPYMKWDCRPKPKYVDFMQYTWYWIDGTLYALLPMALILVLNSLIIFAVRKSGKKQRKMTNNVRNKSEKASQQRQITTMLLTASIIFVFLILPNCIFFIAEPYWTWKETALGIAQYFLLKQVVFLLSDLIHAINFYLYCLSGRRFRQKFLQLACPCRKKRLTAMVYSQTTANHMDANVSRDVIGHSCDSTGSTIAGSPTASPAKCAPNTHNNGTCRY